MFVVLTKLNGTDIWYEHNGIEWYDTNNVVHDDKLSGTG